MAADGPLAFLDTNILLNHLLQEDVARAERATAILKRVEDGELLVRTSDTVVFEAVFTLQRAFKVPRERIARDVLALLELPGIVLPAKDDYRRVFELFLSTNIGFADCYHAVLMQRLGLTEVFSFDRDFDKLPGVTRREE